MIMQLQDWNKHPKAIPHWKTTNTSFLRESYRLKRRGNKNYKFMLALVNPLLKDVNPHAPDLPTATKAMIIEECTVNFWYFLREVVRLPSHGSSETIPIKLNRGIMAMYYLFFSGIATFLILPRQQGKSISHDVLYDYLIDLGMVSSNIFLATKDSTLRGENVERLKALSANKPDYLRTKSKDDKMNTDIIENKALGNAMKIGLAQKSHLAAKNMGRGGSYVVTACDEINYLFNARLSIPSLLSAGATAKRVAKANGRPFGTLFYSTVGYLDSDSGDYGKGIYDGAVRFTDDMYDCATKEELLEVVKRNSTGNMDIVLIEMNHRDLGITDEDMVEIIRSANVTQLEAEVEFLNIWQKGSMESVLSRNQIAVIHKSRQEHIQSDISEQGFILRWHVDKEKYKNRHFVIGLDSSEMLGNDGTAIFGMDPTTGETIFAGEYNDSSINDFGLFLYTIMRDYPKCVMIGERKSTYLAIQDQVFELMKANGEEKNVFKRFFNWEVQDENLGSVLSSVNGEYNLAYRSSRKNFGYATAGAGRATREGLYNKLTEAVDLLGNNMKDKTLVSQVSRLEKKNNRIDHRSNEHDDLVIAYLLCFWFLRNGRNLEYYGINKSTVLTVIDSGDLNDNVNKRERIKHNETIQNEINKYIDELSETKDAVERLKIQLRIRILSKDLDEEFLTSLNIEARMEQVIQKLKGKSDEVISSVREVLW